MILRNKLASTVLVGLLAFAFFAASAHARTIYRWDDYGDEGWDVVVNDWTPEYAFPWTISYFGGYATFLEKDWSRDTASIDTTLISKPIDLTGVINAQIKMEIGVDDEETIPRDDKAVEFGIRRGPDEPITLLDDWLENDPEPTVVYDLEDYLGETDVQFTWRFAATTNERNVDMGVYMARMCVTGDCPTQTTLAAHDGIEDGQLEINTYGDHFVTCMPATEIPHYATGFQIRFYASVPNMDVIVQAWMSPDAPGSTPRNGELPVYQNWMDGFAQGENVVDVKFGCSGTYSKPIGTQRNYCIGFRDDTGDTHPMYIPYQNVPYGTSHSYTKGVDGADPWKQIPDKEFLFFTYTETDCEGPPATTTSTTTSTTTTTVPTTTSTTTTTPATTSTTVTSTTVATTSTTTVPTTTSTTTTAPTATTTTTSMDTSTTVPTTTSTTLPTSGTTTSTTGTSTTTSVSSSTTTTTSPTGDDDDDDDSSGCGS
ncbi:hypothetical protein KDL45_11430 [bacterium]|nr:hypothetical protein [bacterium]